jgi:hypothetical protein
MQCSGGKPERHEILLSLISPDCVFDASPVPQTYPDRFIDSRELIKQVKESRIIGEKIHYSNFVRCRFMLHFPLHSKVDYDS